MCRNDSLCDSEGRSVATDSMGLWLVLAGQGKGWTATACLIGLYKKSIFNPRNGNLLQIYFKPQNFFLNLALERKKLVLLV